MSLTFIGIFTAFLGPFLTQTLGLTEGCSGEISGKLLLWVPLLGGLGTAAWGRYRKGDLTVLGARKAELIPVPLPKDSGDTHGNA